MIYPIDWLRGLISLCEWDVNAEELIEDPFVLDIAFEGANWAPLGSRDASDLAVTLADYLGLQP